MENFRWRLNSILSSHFRVDESVVFISHEVHERGGSVRKLIRLLNISKKSLFGEAELHLGVKEGDVVEVGDDSLHGETVSHLDHGTALLSLEVLDSDNITIQTEQVEHPGAVHLVTVDTVHHAHTAA